MPITVDGSVKEAVKIKEQIQITHIEYPGRYLFTEGI